MDKEKLKELYALAQDMMKTCPDEADCTDAENEIYDEIANLLQAIKNSKLI
jgi:hypothetical protein